MTDLVIQKSNIENIQPVPQPPLVLGDGQVLVQVVKFAFTANVISYAKAGVFLKYFDFFPTEDPNTAKIPTWGIGVVVASRCGTLLIGERLYGYFPMSSYLILKPKLISSMVFRDISEHRNHLPTVYNEYVICRQAPYYERRYEDFMCILRPLYITSWVLSDFLQYNKFFDSNIVFITSASSKTSFGLAYALRKSKIGPDIKVIALTSPANRQYVEGIGLYDSTVLYDDLYKVYSSDSILTNAIVVDMAGNAKVIRTIQELFKEKLKYICTVGSTHSEVDSNKKLELKTNLNVVQPKFFFAPDQIKVRVNEYGLDKLFGQIDKSYTDFVFEVEQQGWITLEEIYGSTDICAKYVELCQGKVNAEDGIMCSLWNKENTFLLDNLSYL